MSYVLDTNACIALINGTSAAVLERFEAEVANHSEVFVSAITGFELWYGAAKSRKAKSTAEWVNSFFSGPIRVIPFDMEDAIAAGRVRAELQTVGMPIGPYDLLIAGQALRRGLTLVTANVKEFRRVKSLKREDWTVTSRRH